MKIRVSLSIICIFVLGHFCRSQSFTYIDSAVKFIPLKKDSDTTKTNLMSGLAFEYSYIDLDSGLVIAKNALELARKQNYKRGTAFTLNVMGTIYQDKGDYKMALECFTEARMTYEILNDKEMLSVIYGNEGNTHSSLKDFKNARHYKQEAAKITRDLNNVYQLYPAYLNLGIIYLEFKMVDSALYYFDLASTFPIKQKSMTSLLTSSKANCYRLLKKYDLAEKESLKALALAKEIESDYMYYAFLIELGDLYVEMRKYKEAEPILLEGLTYSKKTSLINSQIMANLSLHQLYTAKNNFEKALYYHVAWVKLNDSINNAETNKIARELEKKYEDEKKKTQIEKLSFEKKESDIENKRKGDLLIFAVIACALVLSALGFAIYAFINKRKANVELETLHKEVNLQRNALFDKNKNITDSILYAQRIQKALLTSHNFIKESVPNFFILNKPKDIVSGDFYWAQRSDKYFYFMLADCTGHGVPGAFMSLLGISYLNELVRGRGLKETNIIVDQLRSEIINTLSDNNESNYQIKDGMDGVFCKFNFTKNILEYTAANNAIVIVRNNLIIDLKGDKMPIGRSPKDNEHFRKHEFGLQKNDMIYMFTDGFPDQFGGPNGKKLKEKYLKEILVKYSALPLKEQEKNLSSYFEEWKGKLEQIDDVCLVGFKI